MELFLRTMANVKVNKGTAIPPGCLKKDIDLINCVG